ncbi:MAG: hypothetical protein K6B28_09555, partial [Lachnospiraceae bacterium]|nr:hypothetical protein [Lachnospiraceae bacterium]MCR5108396.1 hypothetical protein [Lachnospiraceae bacterium]
AASPALMLQLFASNQALCMTLAGINPALKANLDTYAKKAAFDQNTAALISPRGADLLNNSAAVTPVPSDTSVPVL